jgi:phage baseplate assembly protein W
MSGGAHLGRGPAFPLRPAEHRLALVEGGDKIVQSIEIILDTEPGERVHRPDFGCGLRRYLMKPNTAPVRALIQRDVQVALSQWEPRIELTSVQVVTVEGEPSRVDICIAYVHTRDRRPGNLVFPFYLE